MKKLYAEVNEMKSFMNSLRQGSAIGEMFNGQPKPSLPERSHDSDKVKRLEELKKAREEQEQSTDHRKELQPVMSRESLDKLSNLKSLQRSI